MRKLMSALVLSSLSSLAFANDLTGLWQNIDDKTGSPKALLEIRKANNGTYTAKDVHSQSYSYHTTCRLYPKRNVCRLPCALYQ